jgi:hypothetical protein
LFISRLSIVNSFYLCEGISHSVTVIYTAKALPEFQSGNFRTTGNVYTTELFDMGIKRMARWIFFLLLLFSLSVVSLGAGSPSAAQSGPTAQPPISVTAIAGTPVQAGPPCSPGLQPPSELILTLRDSGKTFTIFVGTLIVLQIPRLPFSRLIYDPAILNLLPPCEDLRPLSTPEPPDFPYPESGWRLIAVGRGTTALAVESEPCRLPPCPMLPSFNFHVTIVVGGPPYPTHPPPVVTPYRSEKYIGTAYLNQTVAVRVGQVVILDLPFLTSQRPVQLSFDSAILQPLPGQRMNYLPPQGWHFLVVQPGTSTLIVRENPCPGGETNCSSGMLFQVTITAAP